MYRRQRAWPQGAPASWFMFEIRPNLRLIRHGASRALTADDYTYMHSVAVCAMMVSLARTLGLGEGQVREAG